MRPLPTLIINKVNEVVAGHVKTMNGYNVGLFSVH